ncbi:hypothetical protein [Actinomadura napierensis]|uniref:Uncharacterized protein n=1 Tax=Actinomadura napierensis TaxID=267854 RepID=A0ABN2ZKU7_9ACTN
MRSLLVEGGAMALDDPVGESLRGHHAHLARRLGRAAAYLPGVATFSAVPADPDAADRDDLARLLDRGEFADLFSSPAPPDWEPVFLLNGLQMLWPGRGDRDGLDGGVEEPGADSVPEMLDLVARARPGPFWPRTPEMGAHLGIREDGRLVAMAGERLPPPG